MADSNDVQALETISTVVDNSRDKIFISNHCIKAQEFLFRKLKDECNRLEQICKFIESSNLQLDTEIKSAEQSIESLNTSVEICKLGNIDVNKDYLLAKERKAEIFERIKIGKIKYENLWTVSKKRYDSIPTVQKLIQVKNNNETIQANINAFINESQNLVKQMKIKKNVLDATDKAKVVELARYLVEERPKMILMIHENSVKITEVEMHINEIKNNSNITHHQLLSKDQNQNVDPVQDSSVDDNRPNSSKAAEKNTFVVPKLQLQNNDLDTFSDKLHQLKEVYLQNTKSMSKSGPFGLQENSYEICKPEERVNKNYTSYYFDIVLNIRAGNDDKKIGTKNYSEKKLIHILEDVKLDKHDTFEIINKLEPTQFQETKYIHRYGKKFNSQDKNYANDFIPENKSLEIEEIDTKKTPETYDVDPPTQFLDISQEKKSLEIEEIDKIDLTKSLETNVDAPTQFLDISQNFLKKTSQEKKAVSFNMLVEKESLLEQDTVTAEMDITKSQEKNVFNKSTISEESFTTIKDTLLKKHNLDLSPIFVYSKNTLMEKRAEDKITSKFFERDAVDEQNETKKDNCNKNVEQDAILNSDENKPSMSTYDNEICAADYNNIDVSSPKKQKRNVGVPMSGFLFNPGPQGILDSLNVSTSTTGFTDCEDFPQYIDSSLLLSPKADILPTVDSINNNEVLSQEVPNFLTGIRKTGLSFFGATTSSNTKPDSGVQCQTSGFNFSFGNEEKKGDDRKRGGFFNMFH